MDKKGLRSEVGARIRALRESKGLTLEELAKRVGGLHYTYIGRAELGRKNLTLDTLERIMAALEVEPYEMFSVTVAKGGDSARAKDIELAGNILARMDPEVREAFMALGRTLAAKRAPRG